VVAKLFGPETVISHIRMLVLVSSHVVLPLSSGAVPATIVVDEASGKIEAVLLGKKAHQDYPQVPDTKWIDVGERYILPGLVE
jgi:imidazolonepropionase-like amidohydrolase